MSKRVESPVEKFPGYVVLPDPLSLPLALDYEEMLSGIGKLESPTQVDGHVVAFLVRHVEEWHIDGVPVEPTLETFPASPRRASAQLIAWIVNELTKIYTGDRPDPNE